ncbi:MAG: hypothetical protein IPM56_15375 [Ignavibacteriales bacterium]|nr:MAG: hypothetical protein IPM56_15375 [Ignavibacteriales bacterium]
MKTSFILIVFILFTLPTFAQHKTLTLYYPNDSINVVSITDLDSMSFFICGASKVNYGGKDYNTVLIGNQCWLKENLNIGTMSSPSNNGQIEKFCYDNDTVNCTTYGGLYYWDEAMQYVTTVGARGICPEGWHMPTYAEFQTLANFVNNNGNELKREDQGTGAGLGTNTSGFSALIAGAKQYAGGPFIGMGEFTNYWMGEPGTGSYACNFQIIGNDTTIYLWNNGIKSWGLSVRCIRN